MVMLFPPPAAGALMPQPCLNFWAKVLAEALSKLLLGPACTSVHCPNAPDAKEVGSPPWKYRLLGSMLAMGAIAGAGLDRPGQLQRWTAQVKPRKGSTQCS